MSTLQQYVLITLLLSWVGSAQAINLDSLPSAESQVDRAPSGSCEYVDDARLLRVAWVIDDIKAGKTVEPLLITADTYVVMGSKIRRALGRNVIVLTKDCVKLASALGELTKPITMPFVQAAHLLTESIRVGDEKLIQFIATNIRAEALTAEAALSLIAVAPYPNTVRDKISEVYQLKGDRKKNYSLLELFVAMGGRLNVPTNVNMSNGNRFFFGENKYSYASVYEGHKETINNFKAALELAGFVIKVK